MTSEVTYYELTHPQKRIWYVDKVNSGTPLHNIGGSLNINGVIDIDVMKKVINLIIENNEGLRMRFAEIGDKAMQYVLGFETHEIDVFDFSAHLNPEREYRKWVKATFEKCFDLSKDTLFYFAIYKIDDGKYGVLLKIHHIISDGWSIALIQRQICEFYSRLLNGHKIIFDESNSYTSFIKSEEKYISSNRFKKSKDFWAEKLENLSNEHLYKASASVEGARGTFEIDDQLSYRVKDFIAKQRYSLNTFFTAVLMIYTYKVTNEKDLIMGMSVFNRTTGAQRNMIGMFTSTMPLRLLVKTDQSISDFLYSLDQEINSCFRNQKYPYDLIVKDAGIHQSGYDSLFKMTINYYNMEMGSKLNGMDIELDEHYNGNQSYSMQLIVREWTERNIELVFDYKTREYTEHEIETMQKAMVYIAEQLVDENLLLKDVQLVCKDEIYDRLYTFNTTIGSYPQKTVTNLFEIQVARTPHKVAIAFENKMLTYSNLNEEANKLADYLLARGVKKNSNVAILMTHTPELMVSILGVLKTGGTYIPIDPYYPVARVDYLLKDSGSGWLLTNIETDCLLFAGDIININDEDTSSYRSSNPLIENNMDDLAYIIYTSGSTGNPKGVMVTHKGLTNYICWANKTYFKSENEAIALYSSIAFDLTVTSIFTPLISGKRIIIYGNDGDEFVLYRILRENKATIIKLTPAHLDLLKGIDYRGSKVARLIVGGDDLKVSLSKEVRARFKSVDIFNEYGPTETVVGCMIHQYNSEERGEALSVPIGCPIDNAQVYILNMDLNVLPIGLPGELHISGDGVARGYLNNDKLTREKFIDNPFISGKKMYKTGDLARYLGNGLIEYIGRADNQVKLRGHRIELSEIESCLLQIPGVSNTVVVLRESLNAYIVAEGVSEQELKSKLLNVLPRYMMPTNFIFVDHLPLTINGKIDISMLPDPEEKEIAFEEATTSSERELVREVSDVLGLNHVSMNDNFSRLGGDSIKAIQVSSRLLNIGYVVKSRDILNYETLKEVASVIVVADDEAIDQGVVSGSFGLTPIIKWFFEQNFENENHYNQSIVLKLNDFDINSLERALSKLIEHHDALRLNYNRSNGALYYNNQASDITVNYFDLSTYSTDEQNRWINEQGFRLKSGLNIEKDVLFRACVFNLGVGGYLLLLTAHHLIIDGVSWRIIIEDIDYLLSRANDQEVKLPLKTHSFMTWSNRLNLQYSKNSFDLEKAYWLNVLAHQFNYPVEFDRGPDSVGMSNTICVQLEADKTKQLSTIVTYVYNIGIHETLTIALVTIIKDFTGQNDVVIELEGHGREEVDGHVNVSRTVGWFTSLYPISLSVEDGNLDFNIKHLKEQIRAVPNKGFDFGILKYIKNELNEREHRYIRLNYLGDYDSKIKNNSFQLAHVGYEFDTDKNNALTAILDINSMIIDDKLKIGVTYSKNKFSEGYIHNFLNKYISRVSEIIELSSLESDKRQFTPSDFSAADFSQEDLDSLLA